MSAYASQLPAGFINQVQTVAIVGVTGTIGKYIASYLVKNGKHKVTAISRFDGTDKTPDGVEVVKVDYNDEKSIIQCLTGQEFLVITMSTTAPRDTQSKIIKAAAKAGVKWIMPNEYSPPFVEKEAMGKDLGFYDRLIKTRKQIEDLGMKWTSLICSFWYEFSLSGSHTRYGFDFEKREVTFFDDGETKINTSTYEQCGRAVANFLALKMLPDDEKDKSVSMSQWANKGLCVSSFLLSQKDMLASILRVTGDKEDDWKIKSESAQKRFQEAMRGIHAGNPITYVIAMYTRVFFKEDSGNYEKEGWLANDALGLPKEDLDEATKYAVKLAESGEAAYHLPRHSRNE